MNQEQSGIKEKWILASVPNELFEEAKQIYYNAPSSSMRFFGHDPLELLESQLQQLREELEQEKIQSAHDSYSIQTLRSLLKLKDGELAEKDKILEWYADNEWHDTGDRARNILQKYTKSEGETK